jgi:hypothetical protein
MATITISVTDNYDDSLNKAQQEIIREVIEELKCTECGESPKFLSDTQIIVCSHQDIKEQIKRVNNVIID